MRYYRREHVWSVNIFGDKLPEPRKSNKERHGYDMHTVVVPLE